MPSDVRLLQRLVNALIDGLYLIPLRKLDENGAYDPRTASALHSIECRFFHGMASPKGFVEPGGTLEKFLQDLGENPLWELFRNSLLRYTDSRLNGDEKNISLFDMNTGQVLLQVNLPGRDQ